VTVLSLHWAVAVDVPQRHTEVTPLTVLSLIVVLVSHHLCR